MLRRITLDTNPDDCNLHCIMCEEHSHFNTKNKFITRRMSNDWLAAIFCEASEMGITEIIPSTMGEPLLYQHFAEIIELCKKHKIKLNLTTNGTFPKKNAVEWAKLIVPVGSDVKFSWNGTTKTTYQSVMQGSTYEKQVENLQNFIAFRNQYLTETNYFCRVTLQVTFMQQNMSELADIVRFAADNDVDRVKGHHVWTHFKELESQSFKNSKESIEKWNHIVDEAIAASERFRKPNGEKVLLENISKLNFDEDNSLIDNSLTECPFLGRELWISATGKISPCCAPDKLRDSLGNFGNYPQVSINQVVESDAYKYLVQNYKQFELCKTCNMRK